MDLLLQGRHEQAVTLYERVVALNTKALGVKHPVVATDISNWAGLLVSQVLWLLLALGTD